MVLKYTSKGTEFEKLITLPRHLNVPLKVAVGGVRAPLERLATWGWQVEDGPSVTVTPEDYQAFIAASRGELSPAKHVYVAMRTGWFSCRSACYLAAGRPVVVQDTGFRAVLPVGGAGIRCSPPPTRRSRRSRKPSAGMLAILEAARAIAHEYFDSVKVLNDLVDRAFGGS